MTVNEAAGKRIHSLCMEKNISPTELSKLSGVSTSTIKRITSGNSQNIMIDTIEKLCVGLGIDMADFFVNDAFRDIHG